METLSEKTRKEYADAFTVFDRNGDGSISVHELDKVFTSLGFSNSPAQLQEMMREVDKDGNGTIEFNEFCLLMIRNQGDPEQEIREAFKALDVNQDGFISRSELTTGLAKLGMILTEGEVDEMIRQADVDGDGQINYQEFRNMNLSESGQ
jgi:calmodulin